MQRTHFNIIPTISLILQGGLFPSRIPTKIVGKFLISPIHAAWSAHLIHHVSSLWVSLARSGPTRQLWKLSREIKDINTETKKKHIN